MLALYLLTLGASAAVVGLFTHLMLAAFGYASGYEVGMLLTGGGACAYMTVQLGFMTLLALTKPWRGKKMWFMESLSHASVLVLIPYLMHVSIPWPHEALIEFEPLIYLGVFGVLYGFTRLLVFFTVLQCVRGQHLWAIPWGVATGIAFLLASHFGTDWVSAMEEARPHAPESVAGYQAGGQHAQARQVPEGSLVEQDITAYPGMSLSLRWANLPDAPRESQMDTIHVQVQVRDKDQSSRRVVREVRMNGHGWATMRVAASEMPKEPVHCSVSWTWEKEPSWRSMTGMRPVIRSGREVLMSGPFSHMTRDGREDPNIIMIVVEGLGYKHLSRSGYDRPTTPELDKLAWASQCFDAAISPVPEAAGASMSLLTGLGPLRHGYLGAHTGPLPDDVRTLAEVLQTEHYATAAFTEGDVAGDMLFGSGFERGFEVFDPSYRLDTESGGSAPESGLPDESALPLDPEMLDGDLEQKPTQRLAGSGATLEKALEWVDEHKDVRFFVFIRLRELRDLALHERYGTPFVSKGREMPGPRDIFDTALAYLDRQTGAFVQHVRGQETRSNTLIVVTSPYGFDFPVEEDALPRVGLSEACLRVPLIVYAQWIKNEARQDLAGLEDVAPSLLTQMTPSLDGLMDGQDFLSGPNGNLPVSVFGDPLDMTMRGPDQRLYWSTGYSPFTGPVSTPEDPKLYLMRDINRGRYVQDHAVRNRDMISRWRTRMAAQLERHAREWNAQPPP